MEAYIGQIMFGGWNFAPRGWMFCNGQILAISSNTALFSLLGTTYGGNGQTTFALPDLRGRAPMQWGQGPGLSNYDLGQVGGVEEQSLILPQLPAHNHTAVFTPTGGGSATTVTINAVSGVDTLSEENAPSVGCFLGTAETALYVPAGAAGGGTQVNLGGVTVTGGSSGGGTVTVGVTGGNLPVSTMQPYLALTAVICVSGVFPSRN